MIKAIAIDDEPLGLQVIKDHAAQVNFISLEGCFSSVVKAMEYMNSNHVDVVFADIKMPDIDGISFASEHKGKVQIVFTTAYEKYAMKGYELNVTDYLLKPISLIRFLQACKKVEEKIKGNKKEEQIKFLKDGGSWIKLRFEDILYAEAKGNYINIVTVSDEHLVRLTFAQLVEQLPNVLIRVHKSFMVSTQHIERIEPAQLTVGLYKIPIGVSYKKSMLDSIGLENEY